jgi:homoserine kinase type II
MPSAPLDDAARQVLGSYQLPPAQLRPLGNHGGFSGARLWRIETHAGSFCLRAWPADGPTPERLRWLHGLMIRARSAGLTFVPQLVATGRGTFTSSDGRLWELATWLPGRADFHEHSSPARLRAVCTALARLHRAWKTGSPLEGLCPAIERRRQQIDEWLRLVRSGWRPHLDDADPVRPAAERAWALLAAWADRIGAMLDPWSTSHYPLHPCLCDIWHDHVLFAGERVSGIIDYGSVKIDHAAVDLARLLGSLIGDDPEDWETGLDAYTAVRPLTDDEWALAHALDQSGVIVAAANWLRWMYHDGRELEDRQAVAARLGSLVERIEGWSD